MDRTTVSAALAAGCLLLAACSGGDGGGADTLERGTDSTDAPAAATDTTRPGPPEVEQVAAEVEVPRTLAYAGALLTINRAIHSNATPHTYGDDDPDGSDETLLYLELSTDYATGYPGADARFPLEHLMIRTRDGSTIPAQALDQTGVPIRSAITSTTTVYFAASQADLADASLVFDDGDHEPGVLPLTGPIPEPGYPDVQVAGARSEVVFPSGCGRSTSQVEVVGITWDLDAGLDADGQRVVTGRSARAAKGARMARIELDVVAGPDRCGGTFVNYQNVRLAIDGVVVPPLNTPSVTLQQGEGTAPVFGFEIPLSAGEVLLLIGVPDGEPWSVPVEIPAGLP
jgi:hypothetical protein